MSTYEDKKDMKGSHELSYDITFKKVLADSSVVYYNSKGKVISEPPVPWT